MSAAASKCTALFALFALALASARAESASLKSSNLAAPFCYQRGGQRGWQVVSSPLPPGAHTHLIARQGDQVLAAGRSLDLPALSLTVTEAGRLEVVSRDANVLPSLELTIELSTEDGVQSQTLQVRAAPPDRPLCYYADLIDDLIRIFWDERTQAFRPVDQDGFDQYFRRVQAHGVSRLIVSLLPFPLIVDPRNYAVDDWRDYQAAARAFLESEKLTRVLRDTPGMKSWDWLRLTMSFRLNPQFIRMFAQSARHHGVHLSLSVRPFEAAVSKYYSVPVFTEQGRWLRNFLPAATLSVNCHPDKTCFAHYREILRHMRRPDAGEVVELQWAGLEDAGELVTRHRQGQRDLIIRASSVPPLDETSLVLVKHADRHYSLVPFASLQEGTEATAMRIAEFDLAVTDDGKLRISGLQLPRGFSYLTIDAGSDFARSLLAPAHPDLRATARAGNVLGRANVYWSLRGDDEEARRTRVAGIPADGQYRPEFFAVQNSADLLAERGSAHLRFADATLVLALGEPWSPEMRDFQRPDARASLVKELRCVMRLPAFDEIFVNTRSHTSLAATLADGQNGIQPLVEYRRARKPYVHLGVDRAYAPISIAADASLQELAGQPDTLGQITDWQPDEWSAPCQTPDTRFRWRYARNRAIAKGVRALLSDVEREFPTTRIRAVIPPRGETETAFENELAAMARPAGGVYGRDYYRSLRASLNHIPAIGEGMAMTSLEGLRIEPVFLGIRGQPEQEPLESFVRHSIADLADNRGSGFQGPKSFFYEAQESLRAADREAARRRREAIIRYLLSCSGEIREVILYEAADWLYFLPLSDPELCGNAFLDRLP